MTQLLAKKSEIRSHIPASNSHLQGSGYLPKGPEISESITSNIVGIVP
jgi:hypothetical protein